MQQHAPFTLQIFPQWGFHGFQCEKNTHFMCIRRHSPNIRQAPSGHAARRWTNIWRIFAERLPDIQECDVRRIFVGFTFRTGLEGARRNFGHCLPDMQEGKRRTFVGFVDSANALLGVAFLMYVTLGQTLMDSGGSRTVAAHLWGPVASRRLYCQRYVAVFLGPVATRRLHDQRRDATF